MKFRQADTPPVAAAKASFSTSTAYRFEKDPDYRRRRRRGVDGGGRTRWPVSSRRRSCRC